MAQVRITVAVAQVLAAFLDQPDEARYGYDLMRQIGFASGKLYPILARLERVGWLTRSLDPADEGSRRRLYRLTPEGVQIARQELALLRAGLDRPSQRHTIPRPVGGQS